MKDSQEPYIMRVLWAMVRINYVILCYLQTRQGFKQGDVII